jgi:hypothetical protein
MSEKAKCKGMGIRTETVMLYKNGTREAIGIYVSTQRSMRMNLLCLDRGLLGSRINFRISLSVETLSIAAEQRFSSSPKGLKKENAQ